MQPCGLGLHTRAALGRRPVGSCRVEFGTLAALFALTLLITEADMLPQARRTGSGRATTSSNPPVTPPRRHTASDTVGEQDSNQEPCITSHNAGSQRAMCKANPQLL